MSETPEIYGPILMRILSAIAHDPIEIDEKWTGMHRCVLVATCSASDIGILAGKDASVIKAVQDLFHQIGLLKNDQVKVSLAPDDGPKEKLHRIKQWDNEHALDFADELLLDIGFQTIGIYTEPYRGGVGLVVMPQVEGLYDQINTILEAYGRSRAKAFGLANA